MSALATPDPAVARVADTFTDLVLADDDLVRLEFEEIVAAEWGEAAPPPAFAPGGRAGRPWPPMPAVEGGAASLGPGWRPPTTSTRERAPPRRCE
jgi:hypothetical protein